MLPYYNPHAETIVTIDASPVGVGTVLSQKQPDGNIKPITFGSKSLNETEQRYSQMECEALAVLFGCKHFHFFVYDKQFIINTDHKPLLKLLSNKSTPTPRIQRWLLKLQAYQYTLNHHQVLTMQPITFQDHHLLNYLDHNQMMHTLDILSVTLFPKTLQLRTFKSTHR